MIPNWLLGKSKSKLQEILGGGGGGGTTYTAGEGIDITNHEISVDPLLMTDIEQTALAIPTKADKSAISNPNILINPWFTVNQRAFTTATSASNTYVADRWKVVSASGITITNGENGVTIDNTNGSAYATMETLLAPNISKSLLGREVTMSLATAIGVIHLYKTFTMPDSLPQASTVIATATTNDCTLRTVITGSGLVKVDVQVKEGKSITIRAIKLEIGSISTLARDPRPDMATELLKCQRYFEKIIVFEHNILDVPASYDRDYYITPKRTNGTLTAYSVNKTANKISFYTNGQWEDGDYSELEWDSTSYNTIRLGVQVPGNSFFKGVITIDAEL